MEKNMKEICEVRCIVNDNDAAKAVRRLQDIALEPPVIVPVVAPVNGEESPPKPIVKSKGRYRTRPPDVKGGTSSDFILKYIRDKQLKQITASEANKLLSKHGFGKNAYSYGFYKLRDLGYIRVADGNKFAGVWEVLSPAFAPSEEG
jgi:hypothetical protein